MQKSELIKALAARTGASQKSSLATVNELVAIIKEATDGGDVVAISGFGSFSRRHRAARQGQNPQTHEPLHIAASSSLAFKASSRMRVRE